MMEFDVVQVLGANSRTILLGHLVGELPQGQPACPSGLSDHLSQAWRHRLDLH